MAPRRLHVLSLDGGGVRGLSALFILRRLLCLVNEAMGGPNEPIPPQRLFRIVVGTSTGGLIALMIVKLGMTVDECIEQYESLSKKIFGNPGIGKLTGGFGTTKYSGRKLRELVVELIKSKDNPADYKMENVSRHPDLLCSVVCRELENNYTRARRGDAVFLCSHQCRERPSASHPYHDCEMADAARATSAAPTFFDPVRIMKKILVDGGYGETNNPSEDAWRHYTVVNEIIQTDRVRWVNIGTGTSTDRPIPPKRQWKDLLLPTYIQNIMHTIRDLEKIATDSEKTGVSMHLISNMDRSKLDFYRISATNGVHAIALDDYRTIDNKELERLTNEYLRDPQVEADLKVLARLLADDYTEKTKAMNATVGNENRPHLSSTLSSNRRYSRGIEGLRASPATTDVPSMAGASEITADNSSVTGSVSRNHQPDSIVPLAADNIGVGDQFNKTPRSTATEFGPPTRSSTAPPR